MDYLLGTDPKTKSSFNNSKGKWAYKNYQKGYWLRNPEKYELVKAKMRERSKQYRLGKKEAHVRNMLMIPSGEFAIGSESDQI